MSKPLPKLYKCDECGAEFVPPLSKMFELVRRRTCSAECDQKRQERVTKKNLQVRKLRRELKKEETKPQPKKVNIYKMVHEKARAFARSK